MEKYNIDQINVVLDNIEDKLEQIHSEVKKTNGKVAEIEKWRLEKTEFIDDMYAQKSKIIMAIAEWERECEFRKDTKAKIVSKIIDLIGIGIVSGCSFLLVTYLT